MRIVFAGAVDFSRHALVEVLSCGGEVVAVLTLDPAHAGFNSDFVDLSPVAERHHIALHRIKNINGPETLELIRSLKPDVVFVFGWSQLISKAVLEIPPLGCIGTHPALLPKNRGRHPLIWTLVHGLSQGGLTFFYLDEGADSGDILWQKGFPVTLEDDAGTLYQKIKILATDAIKEFLPQLIEGKAPRLAQDHAQANYWRKRGQSDGEIHWDRPTMEIYNLTRALTRPYVGAHAYHGQDKVLIWRSRLPSSGVPREANDLAAGAVFSIRESGIVVRTGDGFLDIVEYEHKGGRVLAPGDRLGGFEPALMQN
ncbi:MAG: methionyl-tRNA formyltransferase [Elusimicrobia bacterium]|nr:methionyl-tRNA formyltransferase [Elusimicrobiota bacterium]